MFRHIATIFRLYAIGYRPKHVDFFLASKHHHLAIYLQLCFLTEFTSQYSLNAQRGWHTSDGAPQMAHLRIHIILSNIVAVRFVQHLVCPMEPNNNFSFTKQIYRNCVAPPTPFHYPISKPLDSSHAHNSSVTPVVVTYIAGL